MKRLLYAAIILFLPLHSFAGFPEGESGYDLKKLKSHSGYPVMRSVMMIVLPGLLVWGLALGCLG